MRGAAGFPTSAGRTGCGTRWRPRSTANGNGLATISALLGHASTAVTSKICTDTLKGADRAAVDQHAVVLFGPVEQVRP